MFVGRRPPSRRTDGGVRRRHPRSKTQRCGSICRRSHSWKWTIPSSMGDW